MWLSKYSLIMENADTENVAYICRHAAFLEWIRETEPASQRWLLQTWRMPQEACFTTWQEVKPAKCKLPSQEQGEARGLYLVSLLKVMDPVRHSIAQAGKLTEVRRALTQGISLHKEGGTHIPFPPTPTLESKYLEFLRKQIFLLLKLQFPVLWSKLSQTNVPFHVLQDHAFVLITTAKIIFETCS